MHWQIIFRVNYTSILCSDVYGHDGHEPCENRKLILQGKKTHFIYNGFSFLARNVT